MANDRIFIRCKNCEEEQLVIKHYPGNSYVWTGNNNEFNLNDWLEEHVDCSKFAYSVNLHGDNCFEFFTESKKEK